MKRNENPWYQHFKLSVLLMTGFTALLVGVSPKQAGAVNLGGATHIGTFEGQTTFQTSSSNGINPGLYLEVMDRYGNYKTYTSEDGVITVDGTKEGAYVTQAKLLGKTKYRDVQTGELLDQWEDGRDLKLESVKMPVLKSVEKNLMLNTNDVKGVNSPQLELNYVDNGFTFTSTDSSWKNVWYDFYLKPNTQYTISYISNLVDCFIFKSKVNTYVSGELITSVQIENKDEKNLQLFQKTFITPNNGFIRIRFTNSQADGNNVVKNIQLEEGSTATPYEPYKSNILTTNEEVELRGIGEVKDELNLLTGELTQRFGKGTLNGTENINFTENMGTVNRYFINIKLPNALGQSSILGLSNRYKYITHYTLDEEHFYVDTDGNVMLFSKLEIEDLKKELDNSNLHIIYQLATESVKTVDLTSTYTFGTVAMRDVYVDGKVKPLLCSVNVPTENLTFVLDPNQEEEKQFIAPTFRLINETPTSVRVSLTAFKQESNVFNDVSPTKYENWSQLNKEQSKDIALALVPLASDNWVTVDETPRYVNNYSASVLGEIKAKSSVDLTFKALHGQAFTEELNPQYRLVFLFDF